MILVQSLVWQQHCSQQTHTMLLLLSYQQLLQRYQLLLLLGEGNQLLGVAHSQGAAQETCQGGLLGAGGQVGGAYAWAAQTPKSCLDLLHL